MATKEKKRVQVQIEKELAEEAEEIFEELGLNQTTAVQAFYKQVVEHHGIPFELKLSRPKKSHKDLLKALDGLPVKDLTNKKELEDWFKDESLDYE